MGSSASFVHQRHPLTFLYQGLIQLNQFLIPLSRAIAHLGSQSPSQLAQCCDSLEEPTEQSMGSALWALKVVTKASSAVPGLPCFLSHGCWSHQPTQMRRRGARPGSHGSPVVMGCHQCPPPPTSSSHADAQVPRAKWKLAETFH